MAAFSCIAADLLAKGHGLPHPLNVIGTVGLGNGRKTGKTDLERNGVAQFFSALAEYLGVSSPEDAGARAAILTRLAEETSPSKTKAVNAVLAKSGKKSRRRGRKLPSLDQQKNEQRVYKKWKWYSDNTGPEKKEFLNMHRVWIEHILDTRMDYPKLCSLLDRVRRRNSREPH